MNRTSLLLVLAFTPSPPGPLSVSAVVAPRPHYAGQGIEVRVEVDPGVEPVTVDPPRVKGAEVYAIPRDPARRSTARFVIVPGHAGPLDLPAIRARSGERSGASRPMKLTVAGVPADGRGPVFLGGVGPFEVRADVGRSSVRKGETLEIGVRIEGPAGWGSLRTPDLGGWAKNSLKVEPLGDRLEVAEKPIRTFRFRLRFLEAGEVILPPIAVAAFDPTTRRYATKATTSVAIRVEEPPRFDPSRLDYAPIAPPARRSRTGPVALAAGALAVGSGLGVVAWLVARRRRKATAIDRRRLALELAGQLADRAVGSGADQAVAEALTSFLHRAGGRPPGVLTPPEARDGFARLTEDKTLADRAEALLARCDRSRYGPGEIEGGKLIEEGRQFFEGLAAAMAGEVRRGGDQGRQS